MKNRYFNGAALVGLVFAPVLIWTPAHAQDNSAVSEIIVTARKRQESILNVPVVETALPQAQLERLQTQDLKDVAKLTPGLTLGSSVLSVGTQVSLRGVGTSALDPGVDASVALVVDGLQLSQGLAYTSGMFDVGQIEVLKGPQSLFYGKTSPGGVISVRTADPTNKFEVIARAGYEVEAREKRGELIVSGPITDTLKARVAGMVYDTDGFYRNPAVGIPAQGGAGPSSSRIEPAKGYMVRLTALWSPTSDFDARLKINQVRDKIDYAAVKQLTNCPDGTAPYNGLVFISPSENCQKDRTMTVVDMDTTAFPGIIHGGVPYVDTTQTYGSLEMNWRIRPDLTLTSQTGYYLVHNRTLYNASGASGAGPILAAQNGFARRQNTQEFRLNSDFEGPLNFTAGAYFERGKFHNLFIGRGNTALRLPPILQEGDKIVDVKTDSVFGQLRYKILPKLELTAGARWTNERREQTAINLITGSPVVIAMPVPRIQAKNVAPEFTFTYRHTDDMTFFGSLKKGYKSGSFNVAVAAPATGEHNEFGDEEVKGGEIGMKSRWMERRLLFNIAAYYYKFTGLQVSSNVPTVNGIPGTRTVNAGEAPVKGVEADIAYSPAEVEGLNLRAAVNYNKAKYDVLENVPCYGGQMISEGCNEQFNPATGAYTAQSRSGQPLFRAPEWQANFGFDYEMPISNGMTVVFANNNQYSSKYLTSLGYLWYQNAFIKTDLSVALKTPGDRWEVALIGKNLNNALTTGNCANANNQAGLTGGQGTGTNARGPAGIDEMGCFMDRGREVWVRVTFRPTN
jgi:iron complex outermembrane receptor protein